MSESKVQPGDGPRGGRGSRDGGSGAGAEPVRLAERFAGSERFRTLFASGMDLVEETACYLDGEGREAARTMARDAAALYGSESMRLTTRLMQLASWLLLQRSALDGEMTREEVVEEKQKVKLTGLEPVRTPLWTELPDEFVALVERAVALQRRVQRLDAEIYGEGVAPEAPAANAVSDQMALLRTAFDKG